MPWLETAPMHQRTQFIADYQRHVASVAELCQRFGVSRKTGYKWIDRYAADGPAGLTDRSRRPHGCAHHTPDAIVAALLDVRRCHPTWGAKKLLRILATRHPTWPLPARSTASDLLQRHGLVTHRRRRQFPSHPGRPLTPMTAPNEIWTADFKGRRRSRWPCGAPERAAMRPWSAAGPASRLPGAPSPGSRSRPDSPRRRACR